MKKIAGFVSLAFCILLTVTVDAAVPKLKTKNRCVSPAAVEKYLNLTASSRVHAAKTAGSVISVQGNILVVEASSELLTIPNAFDLKGKTIRFEPAPDSTYTYDVLSGSFNSDASTTLALGDDDSFELLFNGFTFPFAGKVYDRCFVNSNGNITFDEGDKEPPDIETLFSGPPRLAVFFTDLDPESSGTVFLNQGKDSITITWLKVPEFFNKNQFGYGENTFQVVLYSNGMIDLNYSKDISGTQVLTGLVAGNKNTKMRNVDFSRSTSHLHPSSAFIEDFKDYESVDIPALMGTVYRSVKDDYDFVTLFSNFELTPVPGSQAFAINIQNDVKGIGDPSGKGKSLFSDNKKYGSANRLQNITFFGNLRDLPSDPNRDLSDTFNSTLGMLAHEVGHRWLTYVRLSHDGVNSGALLGRDASHWSFFFDSDGSFLEGNQLVQNSSQSFSTSTPFTNYSDLDLYLMGFLAPEDVKDSFLVEGAGSFSPNYSFVAESSPEPGIKFQGSPVPVKIGDIIAANGPRVPDSASSQKAFQHLFVLIVKKDNPASADDLGYLEMLRGEWERFFAAATGGKAGISTALK